MKYLNKRGGLHVVRTFAQKFFTRYNFFKLLLWTDYDLLVSEVKEKLGVTGFISVIRHVENY